METDFFFFSPLLWWVLGSIDLQTGASNTAGVPVPSAIPSAMGRLSPGWAPWTCIMTCLWPQLWTHLYPTLLTGHPQPHLGPGSSLYWGAVGLHPDQWRQCLCWVTLRSHLITPLRVALHCTTSQKGIKKYVSLWWVRKNPVKKQAIRCQFMLKGFWVLQSSVRVPCGKMTQSRKMLNK